MSDLGLFEGDPEAAAALAGQQHEALARTWFAELPDKPSTCRAAECGAQLTWVLTRAGEWMPLDYRPDKSGNIEIEQLRGPGGGVVALARVVSDAEIGMSGVHGWDAHRPATRRYMPHWSTCKDPDHFRRRT